MRHKKALIHSAPPSWHILFALPVSTNPPHSPRYASGLFPWQDKNSAPIRRTSLYQRFLYSHNALDLFLVFQLLRRLLYGIALLLRHGVRADLGSMTVAVAVRDDRVFAVIGDDLIGADCVLFKIQYAALQCTSPSSNGRRTSRAAHPPR